ncbi:MAG: metalloregulator ArsR/SmtB family transcription factor [Geothermobacteraceae bacterium]
MQVNTDVCQVSAIDRENVERAARQLPTAAVLTGIAATFKLLGDPTRLKILHALADGELCVCELAALLELSVSAVSHQRRLLRNQGVVDFRRAGKMAYYRLQDDHIRQVVADMRSHIERCR